jgi:anti-sigma factor (TIGR02949 family)
MTESHDMTCEEALRLLAEYLDGELASVAQRDVHRHLETCRGCYSRAEFERQLKVQLVALGVAAVPPELEQRVRGLIGQFAVAPSPPNADDPSSRPRAVPES